MLKHGYQIWWNGSFVPITSLRSISCYYSLKYKRNWWHKWRHTKLTLNPSFAKLAFLLKPWEAIVWPSPSCMTSFIIDLLFESFFRIWVIKFKIPRQLSFPTIRWTRTFKRDPVQHQVGKPLGIYETDVLKVGFCLLLHVWGFLFALSSFAHLGIKETKFKVRLLDVYFLILQTELLLFALFDFHGRHIFYWRASQSSASYLGNIGLIYVGAYSITLRSIQ